MKEIKAIIQPFMLQRVLDGLHLIDGLPAVTVSDVRGVDTGRGSFEQITKTKLELMVPDNLAERVLGAIQSNAHTGNEGDGSVFVIPIESSVKIRTGEHNNEST